MDLARLRCPDCGITFAEFRATGRLGCANDYTVFGEGLRPLLDRVQRSTHHNGKQPKRSRSFELMGERRQLRRRLRQAVEKEEYEEAGRIRQLLDLEEIKHGP